MKFPRDYGTTIVDGKGVANFTGNSATDYAIRCMNTENDGGGNSGDAMYLYSLDRAVYISNGSLWLATNAAYKPGGGSWSNTASDRRVKQYENELSGSLDMIKALKPKKYKKRYDWPSNTDLQNILITLPWFSRIFPGIFFV